jgi:hypothetical protein
MRGHSTHYFHDKWSLVANHNFPSKAVEAGTQAGNPRNSIQVKGTMPEEGFSEGSF